MRIDREQANIMRQSGSAYSDIKEKLGVPLSTLSSWFKGQNWSDDIAKANIKKLTHSSSIRLVVLNTIRGNRLKKVYEEARQDALVDFEELKYHPLFIAGVMTYWSHGDLTSKSRISVSSTDDKVISIFGLFIQSVCGVKKLRIRLQINAGVNEPEAIQHWMSRCGLKQEDFAKTIRSGQKKTTKRQKFGVCNVSVNSAYLKNKILRWIELMTEEVIGEKYLENAGII